MILFTKFDTLQKIKSDKDIKRKISEERTVIWNLNSYKEGVEGLHILPPPNNTDIYNNISEAERVKDTFLFNYIFCNDGIFYEFFSKVIYPFYSGFDVIILIEPSGIFEMQAESIMKIIQGRYGYNCVYIREPYDIDYVSVDSNMSLNGIYNFDIDKVRYTNLIYLREGCPIDIGRDNFEDTADTALRY